MRSSLTAFMLILTALPPMTGGAFARADEASVRAAIQKEMDQYAAAGKRLDNQAVLEWGKTYLASGWTQKQLDGKIVTREQALKGVAQDAKQPLPPGLKCLALTETIDRIQVKGNTATTWITENQTLSKVDKDGRLGPKGKAHRIQTILKNVYKWALQKGKWMDTFEEVTSEKSLVDGKPSKVKL